MQVIFIHHSCFLVEIDDKVFIFDYFDGDKLNDFTFTGKLPTYAPETEIYMFASHSHKDHYDMDILRWTQQYPNISYIFSKDIRISPNFLKKHGINPAVREKVLFVSADKKYELGDMKIQTLRSTDAGVAFYVEYKGVTLFHAGDLNDWNWEGAGDLINGKVTRTYQREIKRLEGKPLNVAFVPFDPRLAENQHLGLEYFLKHTDAEYVFPMHMWQDYTTIKSFKKRLSNRAMAERIMEIERENQVFLFGEN